MTEAAKQQNLGRVTDRATDAVRTQFDDMKARVNDVRAQAIEYTEEVTDLVERHPIYAIAGAAAVGFILGALLTRK